MILTFLGTASAQGFPEAFCECPNCQQARAWGGASLRKRSAALINADLLIDLGPDIMTAANGLGLSLSKVRYCLQTHPHADHLDLSHLQSRSPGYGNLGAACLHFYAASETLQRAAQTFVRDLDGFSLLSPEAETTLNLKIHEIRPFQPIAMGNYKVTAFPATHAFGLGGLLYAIEQGGKSVFYATDTGPLLDSTWQALRNCELCFDAVILDHTYGPSQQSDEHLNATQVTECMTRMRTKGILRPTGQVWGTHISHESNPAHPELADDARKHGYEIAYDGLVIEI